jgi:predicted esterase
MLSLPGYAEPLVMTAAERAGMPTRADLAQAYMRFEQGWFSKPPAGEAARKLNRQFDEATRSFFSQNAGDAIRALNGMDWSLRRDDPMPADLAALASLRVRATPRVWVPGMNTPMTGPVLRIDSLYDAPERVDGMRFVVRIYQAGGQSILLERRLIADLGPGRFVRADLPIGSQFAAMSPGTYDISVALPGREAVAVDAIFVSPVSLDADRDELLARSYNIMGPDEEPPQPLGIFRARLGLMTDSPSLDRSVGFMFNPLLLRAQLWSEWTTLDDANDPYRQRAGDYWRTISLGDGRTVPMRVFAPAGASKGFKMPLVVALHGAGGDESMFMDAYGAGELKRLADGLGFVAVSPSTIALSGDAENLDKLVADIAQDYEIDLSRVYEVGHSLGAMAASRFAAARGDQVAAAACIAGFTELPAGSRACSTLVIGAGLDPIFSAARMKEAVDASIAAGQPVEWRLVEDSGHTLVVTTELRGVVEWLLKHTARTGFGAASAGR